MANGHFGIGEWRRPSPIHADPGFQAARAAGASLDPAEWACLVERDEKARETLDLEDDQAVREWIGTHFAAAEPSESSLRLLYEENRDVFDERTFEQARDSLDHLARLRQVRAELEAAAR